MRVSILPCFTILVHCFAVGLANDYDYVKEVLEEDQEHYYGQNDYYQDDGSVQRQQEELRKQQQQNEQQRRQEEERQAQQHADKLAQEREREFEANLSKMSQEQKKSEMRKKRKDTKIVRSVLKAAKREQLYNVLGMKNWNLRIPEKKIAVAGLSFTIPGVTIKQTSTKDIRKAYRSRAMAVHPDKNRDGRAEEAFIAVENAASILGDERLRSQYDAQRRSVQNESRQEITGAARKVVATVHRVVEKGWKTTSTVLGPVTTPVLILGFLVF